MKSNDVSQRQEEVSGSNRTGDHGYYPCSVCGQAIPNEWSEKDHLEFLKPLVGLAAHCTNCDRVFGEYRAAAQHQKICVLTAGEGSRGPRNFNVDALMHCGVDYPSRLTVHTKVKDG